MNLTRCVVEFPSLHALLETLNVPVSNRAAITIQESKSRSIYYPIQCIAAPLCTTNDDLGGRQSMCIQIQKITGKGDECAVLDPVKFYDGEWTADWKCGPHSTHATNEFEGDSSRAAYCIGWTPVDKRIGQNRLSVVIVRIPYTHLMSRRTTSFVNSVLKLWINSQLGVEIFQI